MGGRGSLKLATTIPTPTSKITRPSYSHKKLLDRVAFWIVYVAWRIGYTIAAYNATSVGVKKKNPFLCMCSRNCVIVIINFFVYIVVVVVCQNWHVNRPNKCKSEISDSLHYSVFFILLCYTKLRTDPHVNKDFFLFEFFSKDSLSCSKVGASHV